MQLFFVEGNIGTGKSTFLKMIETYYGDRAQVIYEPVDVWTSFIDSEGKNILEYFYKDPKRFAYTFQNLAFISRVETLKTIDKTKEFVFIERSIWSDKFVFAENCFQTKMMTELEYKLYLRWFDWMESEILKDLPKFKHIYLQCSPDVSLDRLRLRNRLEELTVDLAYISQIHQRHNNWLLMGSNNTIVIDATQDLKNEIIFKSVFENITKNNNPEIPKEFLSEFSEKLYGVDKFEYIKAMYKFIANI